MVLNPDDARLWMDNSLPIEQAANLVRDRSPDAFESYHVSTDVNKPENNKPYLIAPV